MGRHPTTQRRLQFCRGGLEAPVRQCRQGLWIGSAGDQGLDHATAGDAIFQRFLPILSKSEHSLVATISPKSERVYLSVRRSHGRPSPCWLTKKRDFDPKKFRRLASFEFLMGRKPSGFCVEFRLACARAVSRN